MCLKFDTELKPKKFHFLPTNKTKKIITHMTVLVKITKELHFNINQSYRHD
jgi:hypothetical protein